MDRLADERASWWLIPAAFVIAAMVFLTRPDIGLSAFAATGVLAVLALVTRRHSLSQRLGALAGSQVVLIVAISLARVSITGSALPQPLGAKVGTNLIEQISRGVSYVITNLLSPWFVASSSLRPSFCGEPDREQCLLVPRSCSSMHWRCWLEQLWRAETGWSWVDSLPPRQRSSSSLS